MIATTTHLPLDLIVVLVAVESGLHHRTHLVHGPEIRLCLNGDVLILGSQLRGNPHRLGRLHSAKGRERKDALARFIAI